MEPTGNDLKEPIAQQIKEFLVTLGFDKKKIAISIIYDNKLVANKLQRIAKISIEGPINE